MIRDLLKKLYFRLSPVRRSTARTEDMLRLALDRHGRENEDLNAGLGRMDSLLTELAHKQGISDENMAVLASECAALNTRMMEQASAHTGMSVRIEEIASAHTAMNAHMEELASGHMALDARMGELLTAADRAAGQLSDVAAAQAGMDAKAAELTSRLEQLADRLGNVEKSVESALGPIQALTKTQHFLDALLESPVVEERRIADAGKTENDYIQMQQEHYNDPEKEPDLIVGSYAWHEQFPYETFLLYRNGDIRKPIFDTTEDKVALDFACGPGRMIKRMQRYFRQVDGCDIAPRLIEEAKRRVTGADFYVTNGNDLGDVPLEHYDFIYCTISMQHIASHHIRMEIIEQMYAALRPGGKITLQLAYNPNFPYVIESKRMNIRDCEVRVYQKQPMASWEDDDFGARSTNGEHDVGIGVHDIDKVKADFSQWFHDVAVWFGNVSNYYQDLEGERHGNYWATDWIFIHGEK